MPSIISNKPLKYDPIRPHLDSIIELKILDIKEYTEPAIAVVTIQDNLIDANGSPTQINIRQKQFSFAELDGLAAALVDQVDPTAPYMERRMQLLQAGLLYITQNDPHPVYFSAGEDWMIPTPSEG